MNWKGTVTSDWLLAGKQLSLQPLLVEQRPMLAATALWPSLLVGYAASCTFGQSRTPKRKRSSGCAEAIQCQANSQRSRTRSVLGRGINGEALAKKSFHRARRNRRDQRNIPFRRRERFSVPTVSLHSGGFHCQNNYYVLDTSKTGGVWRRTSSAGCPVSNAALVLPPACVCCWPAALSLYAPRR